MSLTKLNSQAGGRKQVCVKHPVSRFHCTLLPCYSLIDIRCYSRLPLAHWSHYCEVARWLATHFIGLFTCKLFYYLVVMKAASQAQAAVACFSCGVGCSWCNYSCLNVWFLIIPLIDVAFFRTFFNCTQLSHCYIVGCRYILLVSNGTFCSEINENK